MRICKTLFCLFLFPVLFAAFSRDLRAQEKRTDSADKPLQPAALTVALSGTVYDPSGRVVAGARVSLLAPLGVLDERRTDSHGQFRFEGLHAGLFKLAANQAGFSTGSGDADLRAGETRTVDLHLGLSAVQEQVVVSASLGGALTPQIGSSVSVITQQDAKERGAQSVFEVLRGVPGVSVSQTSRHGGQTSLFIRGGNSNYNLVMVDGIQMNTFGGDFDFAPIPVDGVDHIEVIRGPQSALYGSNAVSGVMNVVSERGEGAPRFSLLAEGGSFTTRRLAGGASGLTHHLSWAANLSRLDSGGVVQNDNYRNQTSFLSLGYSKTPRRRLDFHFFGNADDAGASGPYGSDPIKAFPGIDTVSRGKQNMFGYQASYVEQFTPRFRQTVTVSVGDNRAFFHSRFGDSFSNNLRTMANTQSEITLAATDVLVAGFEYNRERIHNTFIADSANKPFLLPRTSLAWFVENRWSPVARLFVTAGLRVDDIRTSSLPPDAFGSRPLLPANSVAKANPRISLAYLPHTSDSESWLGSTRLHVSFGTGIRAPNGFELAFTNNPSLKPEKSISADAGIEQRMFNAHAIVDVTYFFNRFTDQIVTLGGSLKNLSTFRSANLANARAQGVEVSFRVRPIRSLEISGEYTRLHSVLLALDNTTLVPTPFQVGQPLLKRPRNSAGYNVTWQQRRLLLNLNGYVRGAALEVEPNFGAFGGLFRNEGYVVANAGFSYRVAQGLEVYGRLNNLLNQKYEEVFGFPSLHLNFLSGVRFSFPAK